MLVVTVLFPDEVEIESTGGGREEQMETSLIFIS
jgi:hypothetical protein